MITPSYGGRNALSPAEAASAFGIVPDTWVTVQDDIADKMGTLEEYEQRVLAIAEANGLSPNGGVTFAYPVHLLPQVSERGRQLAADDPDLIAAWSTATPDLGVFRQAPGAEREVCHSCGDTRRSFLGRYGRLAAAVVAAATLGSVKLNQASARDLCECCKWWPCGVSGTACCSYWYDVTTCSSLCYYVLVGLYPPSGSCAQQFGSCRNYR